MKREICCPDCARGWLKLAGVSQASNPIDVAFAAHQDERMKQVRGALGRHCMCDGCNKKLSPGDQAVAVSIYTEDIPYFEWEHEFVTSVGGAA